MAQDRFKYFRIEVREILEQLGHRTLELEKGTDRAQSVAQLLRLAHTLKGAARVVRLPAIATLAHDLEDVLADARDGAQPVARDRIERVLSLVDQIEREVGLLSGDAPPNVTGSSAVVQPGHAEQPVIGFRPELDDLDALQSRIVSAHAQLSALRPQVAEIEHSRHAATLLSDSLARRRGGGSVAAAPMDDQLGARLEELSGRLGTLERELTRTVDQLDRELGQVRDAAERLRLAPAGALSMFLERAVRDVAATLGKDVSFTASGVDVRVDSSVLGSIQGALLHVVRNAVAHGIESRAGRLAAGKPPSGRVSLRVSQRGRMVSFACEDDGAGIDVEAVRRLARQQGKIGAVEHVDAAALCALLLAGGISTSSTVTDVAGRGIGLDVVREAAERLGGRAAITTEPGRGTTITIEVPLSIASFQAVVVEVVDQRMAIPLDAVRGSVRVVCDDVLGGDRYASVRSGDREIPLAPWPGAPPSPSQRTQAVVVQGRGDVAALLVDRVVGISPLLMRPLPALAPADGVAGVALDAAGDPMLVFDPEILVEHAVSTPAAPAGAATPRRRILVIDDSLTTRMLEQSILESAGFEVDLATSGEDGLEKARRAPYALILVDVEMPGMDGFEFIEHIRADSALRDTPAILVTSRNTPDDLRRGQDVGAQGYVVKSEFNQSALLGRIRELVDV